MIVRPSFTAATTCMALGSALFVLLVLVKMALLPFSVSTPAEFGRWLLRLNLVVSPDLSFVTGLTVVCTFVSHGLRRRPRMTAWVWRPACVALYIGAAIYAVASISMYEMTMAPFTIRVVSFIGDPGVTISSVASCLPKLWLVAAAAVALAPWAARSWPLNRLAILCGARCLAITVVLVAINGAVCHSYIAAAWTGPNLWERRIAQSPHWVLARSCAVELAKEHPFTYACSPEATDDGDFRSPPVAASHHANAPLLPENKRPRNVFLIILESTPAEFFGVQGSRFPTTPNLDLLAAQRGVVFENVYAQVASSRKSLIALTHSTYPHPDWRPIVYEHSAFDVPALPRILHERGYRTCYAPAGHWSSVECDRFLLDRGVDQLVEAVGLPREAINSAGANDEATYQGVLNWIDAEPNRPFFAVAYVKQTHEPGMSTPQPFDFEVEVEELGRYLNSIRGIDEKIAWLLGELDRRQMLDSTLVAITADHGASLGQHGQWTHAFAVYEQTIHVPLVLLHRSLGQLPRRSAVIGEHVDIGPTLLDVLGIPAPEEWQGRSLFRPNASSRAYFMCVANELTLGLRDGPYKYHYYVDTQREELFDVETDFEELDNLADKQPERCLEYRRRVAGWVTYQEEFLARHGAWQSGSER
ncbi:MAG TPA: sulfatase [Pirellulales bacterium]|nr:sulfatase [Pirellulales bacterium]